jgi:hypothetical protein
VTGAGCRPLELVATRLGPVLRPGFRSRLLAGSMIQRLPTLAYQASRTLAPHVGANSGSMSRMLDESGYVAKKDPTLRGVRKDNQWEDLSCLA